MKVHQFVTELQCIIIIKRVEADAKGLVLECATLVEPSSRRTESPPAFRMSIKLSAKMMHSINFVGTVIIIVKRKQKRAVRFARRCAASEKIPPSHQINSKATKPKG